MRYLRLPPAPDPGSAWLSGSCTALSHVSFLSLLQPLSDNHFCNINCSASNVTSSCSCSQIILGTLLNCSKTKSLRAFLSFLFLRAISTNTPIHSCSSTAKLVSSYSGHTAEFFEHKVLLLVSNYSGHTAEFFEHIVALYLPLPSTHIAASLKLFWPCS